MLIQFKVCNYKTFKEEAVLSFVASNYDTAINETENVFQEENFNYRLLKSAVIYGANASGKSKLLEAYGFMKRMILSSAKDGQVGQLIGAVPFLLSTETQSEPSEFEVIFIHENMQYRYGFEANMHRIVSEWLYRKQKRKEVELFYRDEQNFTVHEREFKKGRIVVTQEMVRENALLLSLAAQFNEKPAMDVLNWFRNTHLISGIRHENYQGYSMGRCEEEKHRKMILSFMQEADLGISSLRAEKLDPENIPSDFPDAIKTMIAEKVQKGERAEFFLDMITTHKVYDKNGSQVREVEFSLDDDESNGTNKFFALSGPILDSLENGTLLVVDELDTRLHPNLVCKIVSLYNSAKTNPKGAQLLFNTHDTNLLVTRLFRRDQIWFAEKDKYGAAILYSLADFKGVQVRNDADYRGNYLLGKYGAIPFLGDFDFIQ